jgi:hypothetical protein
VLLAATLMRSSPGRDTMGWSPPLCSLTPAAQVDYPRWHVAVNPRRQFRPAVSFRAEGLFGLSIVLARSFRLIDPTWKPVDIASIF